MPGPLRTVLVVAIVAIAGAVFFAVLLGGPDPETGKCVDESNELVACDARGAVFRLVEQVDDERECPADSLKLFQFRSDLYCGVALAGAPAPSGDYVPCLLLAGAKLAGRPQELSFARGAAGPPRSADGQRSGVVKVRGDDWRIFYVLFEGQLDPGLPAIVANPSSVAFVAYITGVAERRADVAAATRCARGTPPAA